MQKIYKTMVLVVLFITALFINVAYNEAASETPITSKLSCTPVPDLLADYKAANLWPNAKDEDVKKFVDKYRTNVKRKPDPFSKLWPMTEAQRNQIGERVLWENDTIGVLVDIFYLRNNKKPKPLVIPKEEMNFITDASPELRARLAIVAAAASDAIMVASGKQCDPSAISRIEIHKPNHLGVKQLHVHVIPPYDGQLTGIDDLFYNRVQSYLKYALVDLR